MIPHSSRGRVGTLLRSWLDISPGVTYLEDYLVVGYLEGLRVYLR